MGNHKRKGKRSTKVVTDNNFYVFYHFITFVWRHLFIQSQAEETIKKNVASVVVPLESFLFVSETLKTF